MSILRWLLTDVYDSNAATRTYRFPRNPREMSGIYPDRSVTSLATTGGKILAWEGATPAKQFTFAGPILEKSHFEALHTWVYDKKRRIIITDHYARDIHCVFISLDVIPKRRPNMYYSHEYTVTGLIVAPVGPATAPEFGLGTVATP